jgi:hypothetical protein
MKRKIFVQEFRTFGTGVAWKEVQTMETLFLPIASSLDPPEGFPLQDASQAFGNFAEVLAKQYFKEGNPPREDQTPLPGDPASSGMANNILAAIQVPNEIAFPQEKPIPDQGLAAPAVKEGFSAPSQMEVSSPFIFSQPSLGSESRAIAASMNGGNPVPLPDEMPSLPVPTDQEKKASTPPVFLPSRNGEANQEMSPKGERSPAKPVPGISSFLSSISSGDQKASLTLQESPILPDPVVYYASLKEPLQRGLAGNIEMAPEGERKAAPPVDSSTSPISLEEVALRESTGKMDIPPESVKKTLPFSDSQAFPVSLEESLPKESAGKMELPMGDRKKFIRPSTPQESTGSERKPILSDSQASPVSLEESLPKESVGKIESSVEGEKKSTRPSTPQESNGSEKRPVQESKNFFPSSQPSLEMKTNPGIRETGVPKRQGPTFGAAKGAVEPAIPQDMQERDPLLGNLAYILESTDREPGTPFPGNAGKLQEKILWAGPDILPLAAREVQSPPSFFAALTDPLNHQVENGGEIKQASAALSERPDPQAVFQQVGQRILWLVRKNEERIRITLDPPELGQVFLEIDRHKEHIKTILWTDNPATKANLETSQGEIQRIIESEGFKLEKFDVFVQQDPGWFQGRKENPRKPDFWEARMLAEEKGSSANSTESIPGRTPAPHLASRYLNLLV